MTGVIVRSAANVEAGAKTRWSAVFHGMWLLLFVMLLPGALKLIPTACLAGILVYTGYKLVDVHEAKKLYRTSRGEFFVYLATLITIVATDLLTGVVTGIVLSALRLLHAFSQLRIHVEEQPEHRQTVMYLEGAATFIRLPHLATALEQVKSDTHLEVHLEKLTFIDHACFELIMNWEKQHQAAGGTLAIDWGVLKARFKQRRRRSQSHHNISVPTT
jgi:MFS superfamily sulfate permease-like transporter